MEHRESKIVPEFGITSESTGRFFKVVKGLLILLLFEQGQAKIEKYLSGSLRVERAYVLMWRCVSWLGSLLVSTSRSFVLFLRVRLWHRVGLSVTIADNLKLQFLVSRCI